MRDALKKQLLRTDEIVDGIEARRRGPASAAYRTRHRAAAEDAVHIREFTEAAGKLKALVPPRPRSPASTAQKYTQHCVRANTQEIRDVPWVPTEGPLAGPMATGRTSKAVDDVTAGPVQDVYGVTTRLKYGAGLDPPFVVLTSAPE